MNITGIGMDGNISTNTGFRKRWRPTKWILPVGDIRIKYKLSFVTIHFNIFWVLNIPFDIEIQIQLKNSIRNAIVCYI